MSDSVPMRRLTVMLSSQDHAHHHSLATEVLAQARHADLAGATMFQAVEGQGRSGALHRQHLFSDDVALSIIIIDEEPKITEFMVRLRDVIGDAFVVVEDVTAFRA